MPCHLPSPGYPRSKRPAVPHPRLHITHPSTLCSTRTISNSFFLLLGPSQTSSSLPCVFLLLLTTGQYTTVPTAHHAADTASQRPFYHLIIHVDIDIHIFILIFASTFSHLPPFYSRAVYLALLLPPSHTNTTESTKHTALTTLSRQPAAGPNS